MVACGAAPDAEPAGEAAQEAVAAAPLDAELATLREAMQRYADVSVAVADGYIDPPGNMCVDAQEVGLPAEVGAMGIHYVNPQLLGITATEPPVGGSDAVIDWSRPEILMYEPQEDGSLKLLGVEWLVFKDAWEAAGNTAPPSLHGTEFVYMEDDPATELDEAHGFQPHYELHSWIFQENPSGLFAEFNPSVTCAHAPASHQAPM